MNDLYLGLLVIGGIIVAGVVLFNWRQERIYRLHSEKAFNREHDDILLRQPTPAAAETEPVATTIKSKQMAVESPWCDPAVDYIVELTYQVPVNASTVAELLKDAKEIGKPVSCIGFSATANRWGETSLNSDESYTALKIAIQLVNRDGQISAIQLTAFRDIVKNLGVQTHAEFSLPDSQNALAAAAEIDRFCSEADISIAVNIVGRSGTAFPATKIRAQAESLGFHLESDGIFYFYDDDERTLFTLSNRGDTQFFPEKIKNIATQGFALTFEVPMVTSGLCVFDKFMQTARSLTIALGGLLVDDNYVPLNDRGLEKIKLQLEKIYSDMDHHQMPPGGVRVARLFS